MEEVWSAHRLDRSHAVHVVGGGPRALLQMAWLLSYVSLYQVSAVSHIFDAFVAILPKMFDTPMFWNESELRELDGTAVVGTSSMRRISTYPLTLGRTRR